MSIEEEGRKKAVQKALRARLGALHHNGLLEPTIPMELPPPLFLRQIGRLWQESLSHGIGGVTRVLDSSVACENQN